MFQHYVLSSCALTCAALKSRASKPVSLERGFANGDFRNRGNVPRAHAKMSCRGIARPGFIASRGSTFQVTRKLPFPKALLREPQPRAPPARPATACYIHSYI